MNISSALLTGLISKVIKKALKKKLGYNVDISIRKIKVTFDCNGKSHLDLSMSAALEKEELLKILGKAEF